MREGLEAAVCILGGGPAGAAAGRRLAQLGHSVVVIEKRIFPRPHIGESLSPGVLPLFDVLGVRETIERAGFLRPERAILHWAPVHGYKSLGPAAGFQVDRGKFDFLLLQAAEEAGARVLQGARLAGVQRNARSGWDVTISWEGRRIVVEHCFLVDAIGRRAVLAGKKRRYGPATIGIWGYWRGGPLMGPETRVEAGANEWYWGAPLPDGTLNATVFLDARQFQRDMPRMGGVDPLYRELLKRSRLLAGCLEGAPHAPAQACDATSYYDEQPVEEDLIRTGEASFSVDPLSSQGVQAALGSSIHAAAVTHTILRRPGSRAIAAQFYRDRQREAVAFHRLNSANLYAQVAAEGGSAFWQLRAEGAGSADANARGRLVPPPKGATIQLSPEADLIDTPCLRGDFIEMARAVAHPAMARPVVFLGGVAVAPLLDCLRTPQAVDQTLRAWSVDLPLDRAESILHWLCERGVVVSK